MSLKVLIQRIEDRIAHSGRAGDLVIGALRTYRTGLTLLYHDVMTLRKTQPSSSPQSLSYTQSVLRHSTRADVIRGVPVVLFFVLPVVGNTLPILTHFFPRLLPRTFRSHKQNVKIAYDTEMRYKNLSASHDHFMLWSSFTPWMSRVFPKALQKKIGNSYAQRLAHEDSLLLQHHDTIDVELTTRQVQNALLARGKFFNIPASSIDSIPWFVPNNGRDDPMPSGLDDASLRALLRNSVQKQ